MQTTRRLNLLTTAAVTIAAAGVCAGWFLSRAVRTPDVGLAGGREAAPVGTTEVSAPTRTDVTLSDTQRAAFVTMGRAILDLDQNPMRLPAQYEVALDDLQKAVSEAESSFAGAAGMAGARLTFWRAHSVYAIALMRIERDPRLLAEWKQCTRLSTPCRSKDTSCALGLIRCGAKLEEPPQTWSAVKDAVKFCDTVLDGLCADKVDANSR